MRAAAGRQRVEDYKETVANYFGEENVHPVGLALVLLLGLSMLLVPRRWAILPMVLASCSVSAAQRFVVLGFNFDFLRLMILFGFARLLLRGEMRAFKWNAVDRWMTAFGVICVLVFCIRQPDGDSLKNRLGWAFDAFGFYFFFRYLFSAESDPRWVARAFIVAGIPMAVCFVLEFTTTRNLFSVFGGVPQQTWVRDGRLRCQGPFAHPIIAGVYWASVVPILASTWWLGGAWRFWSVVGTGCALLSVAATNSSTPVMAVVFGLGAILLFQIRPWMSWLRWSVVVCLFVLHFAMKKPVWHIMARISVFDSSTGWHRYNIMNEAVNHLDEWWFMGTSSISHWDDAMDMTNEYVAFGLQGGLITLFSFLLMIWAAFRAVGARCASLGKNLPASLMTWALGCALFAHCMNFIALSYFGQVKMVWYMLLALIASQLPVAQMAVVARVVAPRTAEARAPEAPAPGSR